MGRVCGGGGGGVWGLDVDIDFYKGMIGKVRQGKAGGGGAVFLMK